MRELASALDISVGTVSLALRNHPSVAVETRRKVQEFAKSRGYQLNPFLSSLMSHVRSAEPAQYRETLAWLNLWDTPDIFINPRAKRFAEYHRDLWLGASRRAAELGYQLDAFWLAEPGMTGRRFSAILEARGIRGVLVPPLPRSHGHLRINWKRCSAVALSHTLVRPLVHRVVPDHHYNMRLVLRTLKRRGYRKVGLLLSMHYDDRTENRFRSAFAFYQEGLPTSARIPVLTTSDKDFRANAVRWLKDNKPDVVIASGGGYRGVRDFEIGDPQYMKNLGVVLLGYASTDAGYAALDENPLAIGSTGVDQLLGQLTRNEYGLPARPVTVLVKGDWVEGATVVPGRKSS